MQFVCINDKLNPSDWRVEAIDHENEGKVYVAIFSGPNAEERAHEYSTFKMLM